jgi:hypothetical protein
MTHGRLAFTAVLLAGGLAGCGAAPAPATPPPPVKPVVTPAAPVAPLAVTPASTAIPEAPALPVPPPVSDYEPKGRRDPFEMLQTRQGATGLTVASTKLTGIIHGATALALVETADGIGFILKTGDTLGDGRLVEIGGDSVVFAVSARPGSTTNRVVLRLATN